LAVADNNLTVQIAALRRVLAGYTKYLLYHRSGNRFGDEANDVKMDRTDEDREILLAT
jgi:hypothetical protein